MRPLYENATARWNAETRRFVVEVPRDDGTAGVVEFADFALDDMDLSTIARTVTSGHRSHLELSVVSRAIRAAYESTQEIRRLDRQRVLAKVIHEVGCDQTGLPTNHRFWPTDARHVEERLAKLGYRIVSTHQ